MFRDVNVAVDDVIVPDSKFLFADDVIAVTIKLRKDLKKNNFAMCTFSIFLTKSGISGVDFIWNDYAGNDVVQVVC